MKSPFSLPIMLLGFGLAGNAAVAASDPVSLAVKKARLNVVASELLFSTANTNDALASMRIWAAQIGKSLGYELDSKMEIGHTVGQMRQALKDHATDMLVLDTTDYLPLADAGLVEPLAAGTIHGQHLVFPYLLLTRNGLDSGQLDELRGKRIVVASRTKSNLGLTWLETLLAEAKLGRAGAFFGSVTIDYHASACVLPVFFGKIDACVVDGANWESLKELNPQLGRLRVFARSEGFLEGLIALPLQPHPLQTLLIESLLNLHKTAAGEQLCMMFKTGSLTRIGKEPFESVRALYTRYRRLVNPTGDSSTYPAGKLEGAAGKERN